MGNWWRTGQNGMSGNKKHSWSVTTNCSSVSPLGLDCFPGHRLIQQILLEKPHISQPGMCVCGVCMCVSACYNPSLCAVVDTCLCSLSVCSLEHCRCRMHSQVCMCLGAYVDTGIWEQVDPRAHDTEREILLNGQGPADNYGFWEPGLMVRKAERNAQGGWEAAHSLASWFFLPSMAPNSKTQLCSLSSGLALRRSRGSRQGPALTF